MSEGNGAGRRKRRQMNRLTQEQTFKVYKVLERDAEKIPKSVLKELAKQYSTELGFSISEYNLVKAAEIVGVQTNRQGNIQRSKGTLVKVVRALCEKLGEDFDALANE